MAITPAEGAEIRGIHSQYQRVRFKDGRSSWLATQVAIANVVRAFSGIMSEREVRRRIGEQRSPNGVSRVVREKFRF